MSTRAKFRCNAIEDYGSGSKKVKMSVVYDPSGNGENANFNKATPNGTCEMQIDNPSASCQFEPGKYYYADFIPATE